MINRIDDQLSCDTTQFYRMFKQLFDKCNNEIEVHWLNVHIEPMLKAAKENRLSGLNEQLKS